MSKGVNKVILIGNCGQDPEVRYMPNGEAVANVSLGVSESWNDSQGQKQERTEWCRLVFYRKLAEVVGKYIRKGSKIYVEGKLKTHDWQDKDGQKRYTTEIIVNELQMLDGKPQTQGMQQNQAWGAPQNQGTQSQSPVPQGNPAQRGYNYANARNTPSQEPPMDFDDDIPF